MNRLTIKFLSAIIGVISFLTFNVLFILSKEPFSDLISSVFWFGIVGFGITLVYGILISLFIDWLLTKIKVEAGSKYYTLFITLHIIAGTIIPVIGNFVSFFFAIAHILFEKGRGKQLLFYLVCAVLFLTSGIMLEMKLEASRNMGIDDVIRFLILFGLGFIIIGLFAYLLFTYKKRMWKLLLITISTCIVFLPCFIHLIITYQDFSAKYEQNHELAQLYEGIDKGFSDLELDLIRSFENGYTLDLTIHKHSTGFNVKSTESFIDFLPKRPDGYYLQIYGDKEFLYITVDSNNNVIECDHVDATNNICSEL